MYDIDGAIIGMMYKITADSVYNTYYYVKNAQGDIVGITDKLGVLKYTYEYDSWGKLLNIVNASTGAVLAPTIENYATLNPFRYRGYYYDNETGLYYLNSRYYDPITRRFVNADDVIGDLGSFGAATNMFSYCMNNPIDEFITVGPAQGIISNYCKTIPFKGYGKISVTPLPNGFYQIANGHHRVAALRSLGYDKINVFITK